MARSYEEMLMAKREGMARWRAANPERARERGREWHAKNRAANLTTMRTYYRRRFFWGRAMKLRGKNRATAHDLARLWKRQRGRCALTGWRLDRTAQVDHITSRARGGDDRPENLRWLCKAANLARRELSDAEFIAMCAAVVQHTTKPESGPGRPPQLSVAWSVNP